MELTDYTRIIRKRWRIIAAAVVVCLAGAALATYVTPKIYQAQTRIFVSTPGAKDNKALMQGNSFTQSRVASYADVITNRLVLDPVIRTLNLDTTAAQLGSQITATVSPGTVLIEIDVTNADPRMAAQVADALAKQITHTVADLEGIAPDKSSPVKLTVLSAATVPTTPISPKVTRNLNLAVVLGLLLGLGLALIRDLRDTTIKGKKDCAEVTDATVLGGITFDSEATRRPLVDPSDPHSPRSEAFRTLRTNLKFVDAANQPRSIVLTSSVPGEGTTTTAANLAITMAASGAQVCVIEGDLLRPRLLEYLSMDGSLGLTDVLIGEADLSAVLQQFATTSVYVVSSGSVPPNPSELLGSAAMIEILRELESRFDVVIIDAPPLQSAADAAVLSAIAGGTLVVVGSGRVDRDSLARSLQSLDGVKGHVLGLVLNFLPTRVPRTSAARIPPSHHAQGKDRARAGS